MTRTKVKICGLSRMQDIHAVNVLMPEYIGFVFAPGRRRVSLAHAAELCANLHPDICPVGVYVDAPVQEISAAVSAGIIRAVQLHGTESRQQITVLRKLLPKSVPVIKAVCMEHLHSTDEWQDCAADFLLLDAGAGGTGKTFDHELLAAGSGIRKPWFLAGGMNPNNVTDAVHRFRPYAVDVSSGAETDGIKDIQKMELIIRRVRHE